jgi:acyl-CoA reductase-like NAD-dependent aldehyde dehydrogenase
VVVVEVVDTPEQAVEAANRTTYGLTSSILAGNRYRAFELAPKILAGIVNVNFADREWRNSCANERRA